jgi:uncharacterized protein (UPF0218 family)
VNTRLVLKNEARQALSYGWGFLVFREPPESIRFSIQLIKDLGLCGPEPLLITVGDVVSYNFAAYGRSDVAVVDGKTRRSMRIQGVVAANSYNCVNDPGTISQECIEAIKSAIEEAKKDRKSIVYVDGEEDLLSLVALKECPLNESWVIYGHWKGFLCLLPCTEFFKRLADILLETSFEKE